MMEAAPSSALVVIKPDLLLQFEIVALDPPAELGQIDQALECDVGLQRGKPVVIRLGLAVRPLDQQPLFGGAMRLRTRRRAKREARTVLDPIRQLICCQASRGSCKASALTETG